MVVKNTFQILKMPFGSMGMMGMSMSHSSFHSVQHYPRSTISSSTHKYANDNPITVPTNAVTIPTDPVIVQSNPISSQTNAIDILYLFGGAAVGAIIGKLCGPGFAKNLELDTKGNEKSKLLNNTTEFGMFIGAAIVCVYRNIPLIVLAGFGASYYGVVYFYKNYSKKLIV